MPEQETGPVNKYLPPRSRTPLERLADSARDEVPDASVPGFFGWLDRMLEKI